MTIDKQSKNEYFGVLAKRAQDRRDQQKQLNKDYKRITHPTPINHKDQQSKQGRQGNEMINMTQQDKNASNRA